MPKLRSLKKIRKSRKQPVIQWQSKKILESSKIIGLVEISKEKRLRPDGTQIKFTVLTQNDSASIYFKLLLDKRFLESGIVTEPNGLLIDQTATSEKWGLAQGDSAGIIPEEWMVRDDDSQVSTTTAFAFPATNTFWQKGGFFIDQGKVKHLPNDQTLKGNFETLALTENGWSAQNIQLHNGKPAKDLSEIQIGLSMPMVVKDSQVVIQSELLKRGDLRALADLRNFVDWSAGKASEKGFDYDFYGIIRKLQPSSKHDTKVLTFDGKGTETKVNLTHNEVVHFQKIIKKSHLENHFEVIKAGDENSLSRVTIKGPFPPNRIPVTIIGHNENGKLVVGFFDGRQKDSTGVTMDEAAKIMKEYGAINAGIGVAGGDVALIQKPKEGKVKSHRFKMLNSPSNINHQTRPAPNMLVMFLPDQAAGLFY